MSSLWTWLLGILGGLGALALAFLKGKSAGVGSQVAKENAARVEAQKQVDQIEQQTQVKVDQVRAEEKTKVDQVRQEAKERMKEPVGDSDLERILKESNDAAKIERSDPGDR